MRKIKRLFKALIDFIRLNGEKGMTIKAYIYAAFYRFKIKFVPMKKIEKKMGTRGIESSRDVSVEDYRIAKLVAFHVNRITKHTPWESKCFVQALTAQKLLLKYGIESTLYMGVKHEDGVMKAHAWLKCGGLYVTGGTGEEFAQVAKFVKKIH